MGRINGAGSVARRLRGLSAFDGVVDAVHRRPRNSPHDEGENQQPGRTESRASHRREAFSWKRAPKK
jgi:hypothetical protein